MLGEGPQLAYLSYMANRLVECHRVLKSTGSIYLHCDPTMSHYLKTVMDGIFGRVNFHNEIVWCYTGVSNTPRWFPRKHDTLLFYVKSSKAAFNRNAVRIPYHPETLARRERPDDRWFVNQRRSSAAVEALLGSGKVTEDWWVDIPKLTNQRERVGYPTQKPLALLERIVKASSNSGGVVLDPFYGCGTAVHAAQNLDRQWIGIDICVNACKVIELRIKSHFDSLWSEIEFRGLPKTRDDARFMAGSDPFRFERWAASLVDGMEANKKQQGDHGIDGWGRLPIKKGKFIDLVSQVKGGHTNPGHVQAFNGARQQAGADLGIFTCFDERVTAGMRNAAVNTGKFMNTQVVQIYTVEDYFEGRRPALPVAA